MKALHGVVDRHVCMFIPKRLLNSAIAFLEIPDLFSSNTPIDATNAVNDPPGSSAFALPGYVPADVRKLVVEEGYRYIQNTEFVVLLVTGGCLSQINKRPCSALHLYADADGRVFGAKARVPRHGWIGEGGTADAVFNIAKRIRGGAASKRSGTTTHGNTSQRHPHRCTCLSYGMSHGQGQRVSGFV